MKRGRAAFTQLAIERGLVSRDQVFPQLRAQPVGARAFWSLEPMGAPRLTIGDRKRAGETVRPVVARYRAYKAELQRLGVWAPQPGDLVLFAMPIPRSRAAELDGMPHDQKPDVDNLVKALLDALYGDDKQIWTLTLAKVWAHVPGIMIERRAPAIALPFNWIAMGRP